MNRLCTAILIISGAFLAAPSSAAAFRADQLMWQCEADRNTPKGSAEFVFCVGYLAGINDFVPVVPILGGKLPYCAPKDGISNDQLRRIFVKWAHDNPKELHNTARVSVVMALRETFPCSK